MTDIIQVQRDFAFALLSDDVLAPVNILTREMLMADQSRLPDKNLVAETLAYITPRNGKRGAGVIVEKPELSVPSPNLPGPDMTLILASLVLEDRFQNLDATKGTGLAADQIGQRLLEVGHNLSLQTGVRGFYASEDAMTAATEWEPLVAYRVKLRIRLSHAQPNRCASPVAVIAAGLAGLTSGTAGAAIYYTNDGSFPGSGNAAAHLYATPFAVVSGQLLRFAAQKAGLLISQVNYTSVP